MSHVCGIVQGSNSGVVNLWIIHSHLNDKEWVGTARSRFPPDVLD